MIYRPVLKNIRIKTQKNVPTVSKPVEKQPEEKKEIEEKEAKISEPEPAINLNRPPRLNLPKNMAQIVQQKQNLFFRNKSTITNKKVLIII